ncbi:MAG: hypothetical protein K5879_12015 [Lachnospiraceae bacterium]|nr:hypothetical protein [Lachnospiraceae bacterium]
MSESKKNNPAFIPASLEKEPDLEEFFRTEDGETAFLEQCMNCKKSCKQSFRVTNLICRAYKPK